MNTLVETPSLDIDRYVRAFEAEQRAAGRVQLRNHLPPKTNPAYMAVLTELIRVDLEWEWTAGRCPRLESYLAEFPELRQHPAALTQVAFEEYRQRLEHGEHPDARDYARRHGIETGGWESVVPSNPPTARVAIPGIAVTQDEERKTCVAAVAASAQAYRRFLIETSAIEHVSPVKVPEEAGLFRDLHESDPMLASRLAEAVVTFPEVGTEFLGFRLVGELGRGAFGRVYLAEQAELAGRLVALKLTTEITGEPQTLAQLQHTNIVPIYSVHQHGAVQAVCMPYFGHTTLADVLQQVRESGYLPNSGIQLVSTLNHRRSRTRIDSLRSRSRKSSNRESNHAEAQHDSPAAPVKSTDLLNKLGSLSYIDAILWIAARLADGLTHAHARGIVHRDLKPANVLLTDEGQPMLLDFNLAEDPTAGGATVARVGGTLPYMAPEHLEAFQGSGGFIDVRSDIFSLGLVMFELMTGRSAFADRPGPMSRMLPQMIQERRAGAPSVRSINPGVSPAVASILAKCLDPEPTRRYQTAADLKEDIERHLENLPLRHAPNISLRERARKWVLRHPRLTSTTSTACLAAGLLLTAGLVALGAWEHQQQNLIRLTERQAQTEAAEMLGQLDKNRHTLLALTHTYEQNIGAIERILAHSAASLSPYGLPNNRMWAERSLVRHLSPVDLARLKETVAEVSLTWADALLLHAQRMTETTRQKSDLEQAWELNEFAASCLNAEQLGREYWLQRAKLAELRNRPEDALEFSREARERPLRTARDYFQQGSRHLRQLEYTEALSLLKEATRLDPNHIWAWFALGNCLHQLSQYDAAISCYSTCLALAPDRRTSFFPLFNRSKSFQVLGRRAEASNDIDRAVTIAREFQSGDGGFELALARFQRAAFREQQRDLEGAEQDLTDALESPALELQALLARSRVRILLKDQAGSRSDREKAIQLTPVDEAGWNDRGLARIGDNPREALADFEAALKINARYYPSLQNKAHVLSECLNQPEQSISVLSQLLELYPEFVEARIGRAVLLARLGKRKEALAEATRALARNPKAVTYYQAANVYALTAKIVPADAERVPVLMAFALLAGFGDDVIDRDSDMDPVRKQASFLQTLRITRELRNEIGRERQKASTVEAK